MEQYLASLLDSGAEQLERMPEDRVKCLFHEARSHHSFEASIPGVNHPRVQIPLCMVVPVPVPVP
ncbi:MAG: hypothetical protein ACMG6S_13740, partial [Byssovorax sp.]